MKPERLPIGRNLLFSFYACGTAVALAEGVVRATYQAPWYEQLYQEQASNLNVDYRTNAAGLRDRDDPGASKGVAERRILVLGDSFTFGAGVSDDAAVFPELLERRINEDPLPGVEKIQVLNGGLPGSLTQQWLELARGIGEQYQPDVVLVVFFLRDGTTTTSMGSFFEPVRDEIVARNQRSRLYRLSHLYRAIRDHKDRLLVADRYTREILDSYFGSGERTGEWGRAKQNLLALAQFAGERSAAFGLVIFPILVELDEDYPFEPVCDLLEAFAASNGIPVLSLLPAFRGQQAPELWVSGYDQHPNAKAHLIAANAILPFARTLLLSAESRSAPQPLREGRSRVPLR